MRHTTITLLILVLCGCYGKNRSMKTGLEGNPLPSFSLLSKDSTSYFSTITIPVGKPIVLFYFSPICPFCRSQMKEIISNAKKLKDIQIYAFTRWPYAAMKQFYDHYQLSKYPNITSGVDYKGFFASYINSRNVPVIAIYNKDKKLNHVFLGKVTTQQIIDASIN